MKTRLRAWIASVLITSCSVFPSVAKADTNSLTEVFPALAGVELTSEQQTQIENLSKETLPQVQNMLTPEQQVQFNTTLSEGKGVGVAARSLDLSFSERRQMYKILKPIESELKTILTPEQLEQMEQNVQALQQQDR